MDTGSRSRSAHHGFEVSREEEVSFLLAEIGHGLREATDGIVGALGVRVVAREHEELRTRVLDQGAHVLARKGRELELPPEILGRSERERGERRVALREEHRAAVESAEKVRHPACAELDRAASERGEPLEDSVEDDRGEEHLRREAE